MPAEKQFGREQYQNMMTALRAKGPELGIDFCERSLLANSRLAIEASEYARDKGLHSAFGSKVFQAYFTEGRNIGELDVILDIAAAAGLDREEVRRVIAEGVYAPKRLQIAKEAEEKQIEMVPTFIINDRHRLVGVLSAGEFRDLFAKLSSE